MAKSILHIDASARRATSVTRDLSRDVVARLDGDVVTRDLFDALPHIDESWIGANFTPEADRNDAQKELLALSDTLIAEVKAADVLVIGVPVYNFGIPVNLKAWVDMICRAGITFRYTEAGPEGLLTGKRAILVAATGGTPVGSDIDFATNYMRHILGFIGITDVQIVAADRLSVDAEGSIAEAKAQVAKLAA